MTKTNHNYTLLQKIGFILMGGLLTGSMWHIRGAHGWGSSWGILTATLLMTYFIYMVFKRKTNASLFHIVTAGVCAMLTTPAWGTLTNQTSGIFHDDVLNKSHSCTQLSGVFIMLCLGFGLLPLFGFMLSRIFSDQQFKWKNYIIIFAVFFGSYFIFNASVSHLILNLIQPESKLAFQDGIDYVVALSKMGDNFSEELTVMAKRGVEIFDAFGDNATPFKVYITHIFSSSAWAKSVPCGRNYFSEISTISHALSAILIILIQRFAFKDKFGSRVNLLICSAFSIGITVSTLSFVIHFKHMDWAFLSEPWLLWEFATGFISGIIIFIFLFLIDKKAPDDDFNDILFDKIPTKTKDIFQVVYLFVFGVCFTLMRPIATRFDDSLLLCVIVWTLMTITVIAAIVMMQMGKKEMFHRMNVWQLSTWAAARTFEVHAFTYFFIGNFWGDLSSTEICKPAIHVNSTVTYVMAVAVVLYLAIFFVQKKTLEPKRIKIKVKN